jgi:hypothetical protein
MGYGYGRTASGRSALSCDNCGSLEGTRKRVCVYTVLMAADDNGRRHSLPYCPAPALCSACLKAEGGIRGVHGDSCRDGAAASQAGYDAEQAVLDSGAYLRRAAWGSGTHAPGVPEGMVGVLFRNGAGEEDAFVMPTAAYHAIPLGVPATPDDYRPFGELYRTTEDSITGAAVAVDPAA